MLSGSSLPPYTMAGTRPAWRRRRLALVPLTLRGVALNFMECSKNKRRWALKINAARLRCERLLPAATSRQRCTFHLADKLSGNATLAPKVGSIDEKGTDRFGVGNT